MIPQNNFLFFFFFFNDTATTEIYTLSLHDALPICLTAGTGAVTFTGAVGGSTALGDLTVVSAANVTVSSTVATAGGGAVSIMNSGVLAIAAAGDMTLDGAFTQAGTGTVSLAGDITTTDDTIQFGGAVTLSGNVALSTGAGAGDIVFSETLNATTARVKELTLTA